MPACTEERIERFASRRQYIPKADGRQRPLGIAALEDKVVQAAVVALLTPGYEAEFLGFSNRTDRRLVTKAALGGRAIQRAVTSHEELGVKRIVSERQWQISSICLSGIHGSEPNYMTRLVFEHDQPHIRSPFATAAPTSRLRRAGLRKTRTFSKTA